MDLLTWIIIASFILVTITTIVMTYYAKKHSQEG